MWQIWVNGVVDTVQAVEDIHSYICRYRPSLGGKDRPSSVGNNSPSIKEDLLCCKKVNVSVAYVQGPQWTGAALVSREDSE